MLRKWNNAYVTLQLDPLSTQEEIRKRAELMGEANQEDKAVANAAKDMLLQNVEKIFSTFLTAVPGLFSLESETGVLRKRNLKMPRLDEAVLQEAFAQQQISSRQEDPSLADANLAIFESIYNRSRPSDHLQDPGISTGKESLQKPAELLLIPVEPLVIPDIIEGEYDG